MDFVFLSHLYRYCTPLTNVLPSLSYVLHVAYDRESMWTL